jgi:hypothetical protein
MGLMVAIDGHAKTMPIAGQLLGAVPLNDGSGNSVFQHFWLAGVQ